MPAKLPSGLIVELGVPKAQDGIPVLAAGVANRSHVQDNKFYEGVKSDGPLHDGRVGYTYVIQHNPSDTYRSPLISTDVCHKKKTCGIRT